MRTEEEQRQDAQERSMTSFQELARYRLTIKKELRQKSVPYNLNDASTAELERLLTEARNEN